jgi:hypothetical protein
MATARPFAYNTGSLISGTIQVGDLAVGFPTSGFTDSPQFWNGPDEELGYVIAQVVSGNTQPTQVPEDALFLSSTYKGVDITLNNNNQTAAQIFGYQQSVLGETIISGSNKVMFSILCNLLEPQTLIGSHVIGVGLTSMNYSSQYGAYPGNDIYSIGFSDDGNYYFDGGSVQSGLPTWTDGDTIDIAISHGQYWWIRVNGGDWNNNPSANPTTLSNGLTMNGLTNFYPVLCPSYQGIMTVLNYPKYGVPSDYNFLGNVTASVGFFRTDGFDDNEFVQLANTISNSNYTTASEASSGLTSNGYWNSYGGGIVITNLQLYLDAGNPSSYSGTGNIWYDLSGNGNDVTMQNSGNITWDNGGFFTLTSNGYFNNTSTTNLPIGSSPYTLSVWVQFGSSWNSNGMISVSDTWGSGNSVNAFRTTNTNGLVNYWWGNDFSVSFSPASSTVWFNFVTTWDGTNRSIWVNGVQIGTQTTSGLNVSNGVLNIGNTNNTEYLNGNIGQALIYDVALSSTEIMDNFDNTKSNYGY